MASGTHLALVRTAHALWDRGLVNGSSGNISARLDDGSILITPSGCSFGALAADDLVRVGIDGRPYNAGMRPSVERLLHLAVYRARADVRYVIHTHPAYCVVWSQTGGPFPREIVAATESLAPLAWVPFAPSGSQELADAVARALSGDAALALLENHGLIAVSGDIDAAFLQTDLAESCAHVAYASRLLRELTSRRGIPRCAAGG
ncbi:MAG: class II aldolase/adducin family protein [Candidatus Velthaea sp.]